MGPDMSDFDTYDHVGQSTLLTASGLNFNIH